MAGNGTLVFYVNGKKVSAAGNLGLISKHPGLGIIFWSFAKTGCPAGVVTFFFSLENGY